MDKQTPLSPMEEPQTIPSKLSQGNKPLLMMAGIVALAAAVLVFLFGAQIICFHNWEQADCISPRTCTHCGATDGELNYEKHTWENATCIAPATCSKCAETKGDTIGHKYVDGDCETCGISEANATKEPDGTSGPSDSYNSESSPDSSSSGAVSTGHYSGSSSSGTASPGQHSHAPTPEENTDFQLPGSSSSGHSSGTPPNSSSNDDNNQSSTDEFDSDAPVTIEDPERGRITYPDYESYMAENGGGTDATID